MAPQETTTRSAEQVSRLPLRSTTTPFTSRPVASASNRFTSEFVSRVTLECLIASSMHTTCASDLAPTRQAKPSQVLQRMQRLLCGLDRKSTRLNSSHSQISYAVFCLKKKTAHLT